MAGSFCGLIDTLEWASFPPPRFTPTRPSMRSPWTELYLHLVWSTWMRRPLLTPEKRGEAYRLILAECSRQRVEVIAIGGMEDHVHLLVRVPTVISPAALVKQVKGSSTHGMNHRADGRIGGFRWQGGYGAFSVWKRGVEVLRNYVLDQEKHHSTGRIYRLLEPPPDTPR